MKRPNFRDGLARLAAIFTTLPDPNATAKTFYNPGEKRQPSRVRFLATAEQVQSKRKRRVPHAVRARTLAALGVDPSGRQWTKTRKALARSARPLAPRPPKREHVNAAPRGDR